MTFELSKINNKNIKLKDSVNYAPFLHILKRDLGETP